MEALWVSMLAIVFVAAGLGFWFGFRLGASHSTRKFSEGWRDVISIDELKPEHRADFDSAVVNAMKLKDIEIDRGNWSAYHLGRRSAEIAYWHGEEQGRGQVRRAQL